MATIAPSAIHSELYFNRNKIVTLEHDVDLVLSYMARIRFYKKRLAQIPTKHTKTVKDDSSNTHKTSKNPSCGTKYKVVTKLMYCWKCDLVTSIMYWCTLNF